MIDKAHRPFRSAQASSKSWLIFESKPRPFKIRCSGAGPALTVSARPARIWRSPVTATKAAREEARNLPQFSAPTARRRRRHGTAGRQNRVTGYRANITVVQSVQRQRLALNEAGLDTKSSVVIRGGTAAEYATKPAGPVDRQRNPLNARANSEARMNAVRDPVFTPS